MDFLGAACCILLLLALYGILQNLYLGLGEDVKRTFADFLWNIQDALVIGK